MKRSPMKFLLPSSLEALGKSDLTDRVIVPLYLNPESFKIQETKLINKQQTKGGFNIQYWGEDLPRLTASGTTGSGGIEAINILRDVYRYEQIQFQRVLIDRMREFADEASKAQQDSSSASVSGGFITVIDEITNGGLSQIVDGVSSTIEVITNAFKGITDTSYEKVLLAPSLAAFAVSIDLYFQGEKYRGFFENFEVDETANSPGIVSYSFSFCILKRFGRRSNYMPWHRKATNSDGQPVTVSLPLEGARIEELSFPFLDASTQDSIISSFPFNIENIGRPSQAGAEEVNNVGISRFNKIRS